MSDVDAQEHAQLVKQTLGRVCDELLRARAKHALMSSPFEGWAVIREEIDEFWDDVKADKDADAIVELVQVAAMGGHFAMQGARGFDRERENETEFFVNFGVIDHTISAPLAETAALSQARMSRSLHESYAALHVASSQLLGVVCQTGDRGCLHHAGIVLAAAAVSSVVDHIIRTTSHGG